MKQMTKLLGIVVMVAAFGTAAVAAESSTTKKVVEVQVTKKGFEPSTIEVAAGTDLTLNITRKTKSTCAKKVTVAGMDIEKELPLDKTVAVDLGTIEKGEVKFGCAMGKMLGGLIVAK